MSTSEREEDVRSGREKVVSTSRRVPSDVWCYRRLGLEQKAGKNFWSKIVVYNMAVALRDLYLCKVLSEEMNL
jgi:hypothetical protein